MYHFHTRTKTGRSAALNAMALRAYVEVNPADAGRLGIASGDLVEISSALGRWQGPAIVVDTVKTAPIQVVPGGAAAPWSWRTGSVAAGTPG